MEALHRGRVLVIAGPRPTATILPQRHTLEVSMPCIAERGSHVVGPCITFGVERMLVDGLLPTNLIPEAILTWTASHVQSRPKAPPLGCPIGTSARI